MRTLAFVAGFVLLFSSMLRADPPGCPSGRSCAGLFTLLSVDEAKSYALLVVAPKTGCRRVRYRVETAAARFVGHTPPLAAGDAAVVRLGLGYATGTHLLRIAAEGCFLPPALVRRVTLRKPSPDHGWRAAS
jgi:hypothetical protein